MGICDSQQELKNVLVKVDSSVGKLAERSSLLELGGLLSVLLTKVHCQLPIKSSSIAGKHYVFPIIFPPSPRDMLSTTTGSVVLGCT